MSEWNKQEFLDTVAEEFKDLLDNTEISDSCFDETVGEWDRKQVLDEFDIDDLWDNAVRSTVEIEVIYTNTCWDICKRIIGGDYFSNYVDSGVATNIHRMAQLTLDNLAREELDKETIFDEWLESCPPPEQQEIELDKAMEKCRNENY